MTTNFKSTAKAVDKNLTIPGRTGHDHGYRKTVESLPDYLKTNVNKKTNGVVAPSNFIALLTSNDLWVIPLIPLVPT